ncbi:hypothetical protein [Rhizobium sp.]|jgi:hypothetical protein|uniref:hypothetical protein n=1 Tax=Rhizobium sp. TaxID=391 RepID=UPI0028AF2F98
MFVKIDAMLRGRIGLILQSLRVIAKVYIYQRLDGWKPALKVLGRALDRCDKGIKYRKPGAGGGAPGF